MSRLSIVLVLLVGLLAGGLGVSLLRPQAPGLGDSDVRAIVAEMQAKAAMPAPSMAMGDADAGKVDKLVQDFLMGNPMILDQMNAKLSAQKEVAQRQAEKDVIDANKAQIYDAADNVVLGNPKGDVTLVEMFDYNCTYCRGALPDLAQLMTDDHNLRVILKQFPILSSGSVDAARVALLVAKDPKIDYWQFHQKLFAERGEVGAAQALDVAASLGGNRVELMLDMNAKAPNDVLQANYDLAKSLNATGTPTYILGDEMIPGAMPIDQLKQKIANLRTCGSTECPVQMPASPAG
jgi:protein-disulfide isomerase